MILLLLASCLDDDLAPDASGEFIAFQTNFADYRDWKSELVAEDPEGLGHLTGTRYVYISEMPPNGSEAFPTGTMIVKEAQNGEDRADWDIFAMVKRGNNYNATGAHGWEWFELTWIGDVPAIAWRGPTSPANSGYTDLDGDTAASGDCNACHAGAWQNDYVIDAALQLQE